MSANTVHNSTKEPFISAKEPYIPTQKRYIPVKRSHIETIHELSGVTLSKNSIFRQNCPVYAEQSYKRALYIYNRKYLQKESHSCVRAQCHPWRKLCKRVHVCGVSLIWGVCCCPHTDTDTDTHAHKLIFAYKRYISILKRECDCNRAPHMRIRGALLQTHSLFNVKICVDIYVSFTDIHVSFADITGSFVELYSVFAFFKTGDNWWVESTATCVCVCVCV